MPLDVTALAKLTAKLIALGIDAWKAVESSGWDEEDAKAFGSALEVVPAFGGLLKDGGVNRSRLQSYCELVTLAFGEAWRRHWVYDQRLAPKPATSRFQGWFAGKVVRDRRDQLERRLRQSRFEAELGNAAHEDLALLASIDHPLASPWYRALWESFSRIDDTEEAEGLPSLLLLDKGDARREFERHFLLAFREALTTERARPIRAWIQEVGEDRAVLIRQLLAARLSRFRDEHVFGNAAGAPGLPCLPLQALFVEPLARVARADDGDPGRAKPVLAAIDMLLRDPSTRVVLVLADFGRGKSLTARTLAYRLAERFLGETRRPSPELPYPIFGRCQESLKRQKLGAEDFVRAAQKKLAETFLPGADTSDEAFGLPRNQQTVVLLDGLDEVHLSPHETRDFVQDLVEHANELRRFIVFSRPAVMPRELYDDSSVRALTLEEFTTSGASSQVARWLDRWSRLVPERQLSIADLQERNLLALAAVPVLLFMIAQAWESVKERSNVERVDIYENFIGLTARSKLEYDRKHHAVVAEAATVLTRHLAQRGDLDGAAPPHRGMIELLARLAWKAHQLEQRHQRERAHGLDQSTVEPALRSCHVRALLDELEVPSERLELVERGVLLTMRTSLDDTDATFHFTHKSFREFLVAKYWESTLRRLLGAPASRARELEESLSGVDARLLQPGDASFEFLIELCRRWGRSERERLTRWAEDTFNDEQLAGDSLREDRRSALREAALAIGSSLADQGLRARDCLTLRTLLAATFGSGAIPMVIGSRLQHPWALLSGMYMPHAVLDRAKLAGANLSRSNLFRAKLREADLVGVNAREANLCEADLSQAELRDASFVGADLRGANLRGASLRDAKLGSANVGAANLMGADLTHAELVGARLRSAVLMRANLRRANLREANLRGAELDGADLTGANLTGADLRGVYFDAHTRWDETTTFPVGFDPNRDPKRAD